MRTVDINLQANYYCLIHENWFSTKGDMNDHLKAEDHSLLRHRCPRCFNGFCNKDQATNHKEALPKNHSLPFPTKIVIEEDDIGVKRAVGKQGVISDKQDVKKELEKMLQELKK